MEERILDFSSPSFPLKAMLWALARESHIVLDNIRALGFDWEVCSFYHSKDQHALFGCRVLQAEIQSLADYGIIWIEKEVVWRSDYMVASLCPSST